MNARISHAFTLTVLFIAPTLAFAQPHGGGGHPGGGAPVPAARPAPAPAMRQAPVQAPPMRQAPMRPAAQAPVARPAAPDAGRFNFQRDIAPQPRSAPIPAQRQAPVAAAQGAGAQRRAPVAETANGGAHRGHFNGRPIDDPHASRGNWGWNHGRAWAPAPSYWGGGFWGDYALANIDGYGAYGYVDDAQDGYTYDSYQIQPDTPGADLLSDYGLQQVACGPPGLIDIWGPDGSIVCANPSDSVAPGDYQIDPQSFSLVPATP